MFKGLATYFLLQFLFVSVNGESLAHKIDSLLQARDTASSITLAKIEIELASNFYYLSDFNEAIKYAREAISTSVANNNSKEIISSYRVLGAVYARLEDFGRAINYFNKSLKVSTETNDTAGIAGAYNNIGAIYLQKKKYRKALGYFKKSLQYAKNKSNTTTINSLSNMGNVYLDMGNHQKATECLIQAIDSSKKYNYQISQISCQNKLAYIYLQDGKLLDSEQLALSVLEQSIALSLLNESRLSYKTLAELNFKKKQYNTAWKYRDLQFSMLDSINKQTNRNKIMNEEIRLAVKVKEHENKLLKQKDKVKVLQLKNRNKTIYSLILILIIVLFFTRLVVVQRNKKTKANEALVRRNIEIVESERLLFNANKSLQSKIKTSTVAPIQIKKTESTLSDLQKTAIWESLLYNMETEKIYLQTDLTLSILAKHLNTNRTYLSEVVKEFTEFKFNEFLTNYRVKEARQLLVNPDNHLLTIEAIGKMSGFSSSSTFYPAFKKITGITPSLFLKTIKKVT